MIELKDKEPFANGKRGMISTAIWKGKKVAVKEKNPKSEAIHRIWNEGEMLEILNKEGIGPKLVYHDEDQLIYEFVEGVLFEEWLMTSDRKKILDVIKELFDQCFRIDQLGINKLEMTNPYKHILITDENKPVMIDFERAKRSITPKNVTQFVNYITCARMTALLGKKQIVIDKDRVRRLCVYYREGPGSDILSDILKAVS